MVHITLMGDPSLRMHIITPADSLTITAINSGSSAKLKWLASADSVLGYYVYRADSLFGKFTLLTPSYITSTTYTDLLPTNGNKVYMVRAVKLEKAYTGTYYNLSEGIMDTVTITHSTVHIADVDNSNFQILLYPNPTTDNLTIETKNLRFTNYDLRICDVVGNIVLEKTLYNKVTNINVSALAKEMYFVKIKTEKGVESRKFVKL